jgi:DDE superfamily endonuclease
VTKAGKQTHGLDRFFASLYGKAVPSLAFFTLSLISTTQRRSFPIALEQVLRSAEEKEAARAKRTATRSAAKLKRKPGRPKGSSTKAKTTVELTPELCRIQSMLRQLIERIGNLFALTYLVLSGHFGTNAALQMARQCNLQLISKLRSDSALYLPYDVHMLGVGHGASMASRSIRGPFQSAICATLASRTPSKRASISSKRGTKRL